MYRNFEDHFDGVNLLYNTRSSKNGILDAAITMAVFNKGY